MASAILIYYYGFIHCSLFLCMCVRACVCACVSVSSYIFKSESQRTQTHEAELCVLASQTAGVVLCAQRSIVLIIFDFISALESIWHCSATMFVFAFSTYEKAPTKKRIGMLWYESLCEIEYTTHILLAFRDLSLSLVRVRLDVCLCYIFGCFTFIPQHRNVGSCFFLWLLLSGADGVYFAIESNFIAMLNYTAAATTHHQDK